MIQIKEKRLRKETYRLFMLAGCVHLLASGTAAYANDTAEDHHSAEEIIVSATKILKSPRNMSQSVSIVAEADIEKMAATDVTEILRGLPSVEFKQAGGVGQFNYLKLRGMSTSILVVVDGVKINESQSGGISNFLGQLDPNTIERVEVLRGPQATLYGANSTAGVIAITTKSGRVAAAGLSGEIGSLNWKKVSGTLRNGTQIGGGALSYSLNASLTDSDNIHPQEYFRDKTLQTKLGYAIGDFSFGLNSWYSDNVFQAAQLNDAPCCQTMKTYWGFQTPDPNNRSETEQIVVGAHIRHQISDRLSQRVQFGYMHKNYKINDLADGLLGYQPSPWNNFMFQGHSYQANAGVPIYDTAQDIHANYTNKNVQADYNLTYTTDNVVALIGAEYLSQSAAQSGSYGVSDNREKVRSYYANGQIDALGDKVTLSLGIRLDDFDTWGQESTYNIGATYQLAKGTTIFANYGTSFTAPTMAQLFNPTYGSLGLRPASGKTYEGGIRQSLFGGSINWSATYWHSKTSNIIVFDYDVPNPRRDTGFGQYANRDSGRTEGLEAEVSYAVTHNLVLSGNYTYTIAREADGTGGWLPTVQIAKHKGNARISYSEDRLSLVGNVYYAGPRYRWARDIIMPSYVRVDVSGSYKLTDRLSLYGRVENLFDTHIIEGLGYEEPGRYGIVGFRLKLR